MSTEHWLNDNVRELRKYSEKTLFLCKFAYHKSHRYWREAAYGSSRRETGIESLEQWQVPCVIFDGFLDSFDR